MHAIYCLSVCGDLKHWVERFGVVCFSQLVFIIVRIGVVFTDAQDSKGCEALPFDVSV